GHMNHDQTFRAVLIAVLLLILPIGIYHRLKSQATCERLDRWQEGPFILATLRPVGIALWLGLIAWAIDPDWMVWSSVSLPTWLPAFGTAIERTWNGPGAFCLELERPCVAPDTARSQRRRSVKRATGSRLSRTGCFNALPLLWPTESFFDKACRLKRISRSNL